MYNLSYESGSLSNVLVDENPAVDQYLFALCFSCDSNFFYDSTLLLAKRVESKWLPRIALFRAAKQINEGKFDAARTQLAQLKKNTLNLGHLDSFYTSLYKLLSNLLGSDSLQYRIDSFENSALIGDSHTMSLSFVWRGAGSDIKYLPGLTLRGLAFPKMNSYKAGLENAILMSQRQDMVAFSIGEIDSRNIYLYWQKIMDNPSYPNQFFELIGQSLESVYAYKAPYQRYCIFSLPGYRPDLIRKEDNVNELKIREMYSLFRKTFLETASSIGFEVIDHENMFASKHVENLIDHAHFHPSFYNKILGGFAR